MSGIIKYNAETAMTKTAMTKDHLAKRLAHLDPGESLTVEAAELASLFRSDDLSPEVVRTIEAFALEHRCIFSFHEHERAVPCFEKDDIF
jgi:hypothetical protein